MDAASSPTIFLRIGWMSRYRGLTVGDEIKGGGAFVAEHGYGHEIFNFRPFEGRVYGYVQPPGTAYNDQPGSGIDLQRLGAGRGDDSLSGVLAVWVATPPEGGSVIIGWYKNATVYRHWQKPPAGAQRTHAGSDFGYYVSGASEDATLLPLDERVFEVPRGRGGMGQANIWYADNAETHPQFRREVRAYVATRNLPKSSPTAGEPTRQLDPFLRQQVERAAVARTVTYYTGLGYHVSSVEKDNLGWDLNAVHPIRNADLKLEVKGLSGWETCVEVTPNEYARMREHRGVYRLCVVTNSLSTPRLAIFSYSAESQRWEDQDGRVLVIEEIVAARCRAIE
jgi:hypothetical protein